MSSRVFSHSSIEKQYQQYLIKLSSGLDLIYIIIEKDHIIYESNFSLEYLHQHKLLMSSLTTQEMIEFIIALIDINKIEIKEENMNLKLILIAASSNYSNAILNLRKKNIVSNEMIEKLFKEFENFKKENKELKDRFENLKKENKELKDSIGKLNKRIEKLEKNNNNQNKSSKYIIPPKKIYYTKKCQIKTKLRELTMHQTRKKILK